MQTPGKPKNACYFKKHPPGRAIAAARWPVLLPASFFSSSNFPAINLPGDCQNRDVLSNRQSLAFLQFFFSFLVFPLSRQCRCFSAISSIANFGNSGNSQMSQFSPCLRVSVVRFLVFPLSALPAMSTIPIFNQCSQCSSVVRVFAFPDHQITRFHFSPCLRVSVVRFLVFDFPMFRCPDFPIPGAFHVR